MMLVTIGIRTAWKAALGAAAFALGPAVAGEFDCVIEPRQTLEIRSPIEGLIERVNVDRGSVVKKGQVLAVLDTSVDQVAAAIAKQRAEMDGAVKSGESRVEFSGKKLDRAQDLQRQNFVSAQSSDEARTEKRLAEAELRDARDNRTLAELEYRRQTEIIRLKTIVSPVNGVVTERLLHPGELAEAGVGRKPMLKIAAIDVLHVEVILPVEAYGKVKTGMHVEVMPGVAPGGRYRATLTVFDRVLDAASGTFGVRLDLPNKGRAVPAGVRCKAQFPGIDVVPVRASSSPRKGGDPRPAAAAR